MQWWSASAFINAPSGDGSYFPASLHIWEFCIACYFEVAYWNCIEFYILGVEFSSVPLKVLDFASYVRARASSKGNSDALFRWRSLRTPQDAPRVTHPATLTVLCEFGELSGLLFPTGSALTWADLPARGRSLFSKDERGLLCQSPGLPFW